MPFLSLDFFTEYFLLADNDKVEGGIGKPFGNRSLLQQQPSPMSVNSKI